MNYIFLGAYTECLESGRPLAYGDIVEIPKGEGQRLIGLGLLVPAQQPKTNVQKETDADAAGN